jgi:hypothetical protein
MLLATNLVLHSQQCLYSMTKSLVRDKILDFSAKVGEQGFAILTNHIGLL